jgi:xylose isomerase
MNGAATNPDFQVVAWAGAQVKNALDATIKLGGENYVFWGGREGYMSLLNTDMKRELDHLAQFLHLSKDYARKSGFKGTFFIEPKPMEPMKHQYDFDAATCIGFLREYGLDKDFKLNIEVNHATLALHTFQHELQVAANAGMLGSMDANRGDNQNGWDTDQFPNNVYELTEAMLVVLILTPKRAVILRILRIFFMPILAVWTHSRARCSPPMKYLKILGIAPCAKIDMPLSMPKRAKRMPRAK